MMQKYSQEWCAATADALAGTLAEFDADETDAVLAFAISLADETETTAAAVLRGLADQLDADDQRRAGGLN